MKPDNSKVELDLNAKLGLADMTDDERADFFGDIGTKALEAAYYRFALSLDEEESREFQDWMETNGGGDDILNKAIERYAGFAEVIAEEMRAMHDDIAKMA